MVYTILPIVLFLYVVVMRAVAPNAPLKHAAIAAVILALVAWGCHIAGFEVGPSVPPAIKWIGIAGLSFAAISLVITADWSYSEK